MAVNKIKLPNNTTVDINDARDVIIGDGVENVVALTTAQYEALATKDPDTIYIVTDVSGAVQFVALTTAQYEALSTKDPSTLYIITDASGGGGGGTTVSWGTESGYTVPLIVGGVSKTVCLDGYSSGGGGAQEKTLELSNLKANTYINNTNGAEVGYSGWSCTDFIDISDAILIKADRRLNYSAFYNSSETFVSGVDIKTEYTAIPSTAKYVRISGSNSDMSAATVTVLATGGSGGISDVTLGGTSVVSNDVAVLPAYPTVPTISTNITSDASSDTKTASPKAVKTYVDGIVGDIETLLAAI